MTTYMNALLRPEELTEFGVGPGDDCLMVGRHINHEGRQFDRAILRFGNLAMLPELIFQPKRAFNQESFVVDMRSAPGFSGSAVLVYYEQTGPREPTATWPEMVKKPWSGSLGHVRLLGVHWGSLPTWEDTTDERGAKTGRRVNSSMACTVPAWKLRELLEEEEGLVKARKAADEAYEVEHQEGAAMESLSEFDRFEALARAVVNVPKVEIDRKRDQAKRDQ